MRKFNIVYFPVILVFFLISPVFPKEDASQETEQLRNDIQIINLLNNLNLRPNQMEFILQKAKEVSAIRHCATDKANLYKAEMTDAYSLIKKEVEDGKVMVDQPNAEKFRLLKEEIERVSHEAYVDVDKIAASVAKELEEFQIVALDNYKPCVIPIIQNDRIGQAGTHQGVIRILEKVRSTPGERYWSTRGELANTIIEKTKLKFPAGVKFDDEQAKLTIFSIFDKARAMEAVDFGLQKEALAEELQNTIVPHTPSMERADKIKKFLLSDNIIPILEKKLSENKAGQ